MHKLHSTPPAPYALPPGTPAEERPPSFGRRAFLVGALSAGAFGVLAGSWLPAAIGGRSQSTAGSLQRSRLAWAREVADGDLERLIEVRHTWLSVVARYGAREPQLWHGWRRLARAAVERESLRDREALARLLMHRLENAPADVRAALSIEGESLRRIMQ
jgi:hypothetical protein